MLKTILLCLGTALSFSAFAFDLQGHRGARGLAPENTLPAFERALEIGVTTLELDIGVTADGVVVIHHDPYLNPAITRDAGGQWLVGSKGPLIKTLTLAQLQAYDVGRINPETPYARTFDAQQAARRHARPHTGIAVRPRQGAGRQRGALQHRNQDQPRRSRTTR